MAIAKPVSPEVGACAASTSFDAAQAILRGAALTLGTECVPLAMAGGRVLAEQVTARIDGPRCDCAAMDGYAVRAADLAAGAVRLRIVGASYAGSSAPAPLEAGTTVAVATGAPVPPGTDRVLPHERVSVDGGTMTATNLFDKPHVRRRASDFAAGDPLLAPGTLIVPRALVVAAAADVDEVAVWRRPRVNILVNGDELAVPGTAGAHPHGVPESLAQALLLMAREWGAKPGGVITVGDEALQMRLATERALGDCEILVIVGGASHGPRDFARAAAETIGLETAFAAVAMKPGKPLWYGRVGPAHVMGLPGNPTAAMTTARLFLAPLIASTSGRRFDDALRWTNLPSAGRVGSTGSRDAFLCASREGDAVRVFERQDASAQMTLALSDMLVERRSRAPAVIPGDTLRCLRF